MSDYIETLKKSFPRVDEEDLKRILLNKYYEDCIILKNNDIIEIQEFIKDKNIYHEYFLNLPNKKGVFYFDESIDSEYMYLEGADNTIVRGYLDKLKIYNVSLEYNSSANLKVSLYLVEYSNNEIIDILEIYNNSLTFQPNESTDKYRLLLKLEGRGVIYNIKMNSYTSNRGILGEKSLTFKSEDFFLNEKYANSYIEDNTTVLSIKPNERKHIYISYKERNNRFSNLPNLSILEDIDLTSNILVEFNLVKDDTLEFIPMLIEYNEEIKIGQKILNIYNPEVIKLKPEVNNIRLAFRFSGYGELKIKNINFISLEESPNTSKLNFNNRREVLKLLSPSMKIKEFKVACIMDEFTYNSYEPEVQMYKLDLKKWKSQLLFVQPDLVFIESAWVGNNGQWHRKVAYYGDNEHNDIREMIEFSKSLNIPVVFWNKEDPVHYDKFIETAKLCDYVFTTDLGRVKQYKKDCNHNKVSALPFAAQPKNHNPIKIQKRRDPRVSFAGSYYRHHEERSEDMDILLEASKEIGLVIYDRNYEKTKRGKMPNHKFPDKFTPYIHGTLPFNLIDKSYKGYKFMINVNTVKYSETMFSRRVFEGLISGTPIISTYSLGMVKMFGNIINASSNKTELQEHLLRLNNNDELYNKYSVRGLREVLLNHTYEDRMKKILNTVGYSTLSNHTKVYFVAFVENQDEMDEYFKIFQNQSVSNKKLVLINKQIKNYKYFYNTYNNNNIIAFDYYALKKYINLNHILGSGFVSVLNKKNYYSPNYALDLMLAYKYSDANIIGKDKYYKYSSKELQIINKNNDFIYSSSLLVDRSVINISIFDKFSVETTLKYLENYKPLSELAAFGAKLYSSDALNFIDNGSEFTDTSKIEV